jgi:hypothetical protein
MERSHTQAQHRLTLVQNSRADKHCVPQQTQGKQTQASQNKLGNGSQVLRCLFLELPEKQFPQGITQTFSPFTPTGSLPEYCFPFTLPRIDSPSSSGMCDRQSTQGSRRFGRFRPGMYRLQIHASPVQRRYEGFSARVRPPFPSRSP